MIAKKRRTVSSVAMVASTTFGRFRLDRNAAILFHGAEPTPLGRRAVTLLTTLLDGAGAPVGKEALIAAAWPGQAIEDSNLTVQIAAIRRILGQAGGAEWIETLPRRGYRYVGPPVTGNDDTDQPPPLPLPDKPSMAVL